MDLEELFLNDNQKAFDQALEKAINYNNQMIKRAAVKEELVDLKKSFDQQAIPALIEKSTLPPEVKRNFLVLAEKDKDLAKDCLKLSENLQTVIAGNDTRVRAEYLSFFRQGATRQVLLSKNLNNAIVELSQGNKEEAKTIIRETIQALERFKSGNKPELKALESLYQKINSQVDTEVQMTVGKS